MHLTRKQVRELDRLAVQQCGMSSLVLMENAGRGVADVLQSLGIQGPIVIVCGKGNNAGDGFVIARHLDLRGYAVRVVLCSAAAKLTGDAVANWNILAHTRVELIQLGDNEFDVEKFDAALADADWVVDALLGTGASGAPRPPFDEIICRVNTCTARKLAVDLPSGLDCDTGAPAEPTIQADHTCTFAALKLGFKNEQAQPFLGQVQLCDIGAPSKLLQQFSGEQPAVKS